MVYNVAKNKFYHIAILYLKKKIFLSMKMFNVTNK